MLFFSVIYSLYDDEDSGQPCAIVASIDSNMAIESNVWVHELKPPPQQTWNIGDHCRAEWSEDNVIYEGNILAFGEHEGRKYANVEFIGYGNQDNVWMETLMPSQGSEVIAKQKEDAGIIVEENPAPAPTKVWKVNDRCRAVLSEDNIEYEGTVKNIEDDGINCLVHFIGLNKDEAKALSSLKSSAGSEARAQQRASKQFKVETSEEEWKEGSNARAVYPEDGIEYEGVIVSTGATEGGDKYATIKFLGYGNEESVWFQDILASRGEEARAQQIKDAAAAGVDLEVPKENEMAVDEIDSSAIASIPQNNVNDSKNWKVGDDCRAIFEADGIEYEGRIEEISAVDDGSQYALIKFHGYGNTQTAWLADVLPSLGKEAIDAQIKASDAENEVEVSAQPPVDIVDKKNEPLVNGDHVPKDDNAGGQDDVVSLWKVNDFVRAYCKELDEEREGQIHLFHPSKKEVVKIKFLNTGAVNQGKDIIEVKNLSDLKPSEVQPATIQESKLIDGTDVVDHGTKAAASSAKLNESSEEPSLSSGSEASTVIEVAPMKKVSTMVLDGNNNNNVSNSSEITRVSSASDDAILQATAMLAEQLASAKVIDELRQQVAERDKKLRIAEERNEVNEIIFREMRLANSQLQAENTRLKENEAKFHKEQAVLMKDIKTLLSKVIAS